METMSDLVTVLGGRAALNEIVADFYARVQADALLAPIFAAADVGHLVGMQQEFLATALSGEGERSGEALRAIHTGRGITARHFSRFVEHFVDTLEDRSVEPDTIREVTQRLGLYLDDVVGGTAEAG
jgi:hemoglobin